MLRWGGRGRPEVSAADGVRCPYCGGQLSAVIRRAVNEGKGFCPEHGVVEPKPGDGGGVGVDR